MKNKTVLRNHSAFSFISLKQSCYVEATGNEELFGKFLLLFKHTANSGGFDYLLEGIQQNTISLKQNVCQFLYQYGVNFTQLNGIRRFLNLLPEDNYFLIVGEKITDTAHLVKYFRFLTEYHDEQSII